MFMLHNAFNSELFLLHITFKQSKSALFPSWNICWLRTFHLSLIGNGFEDNDDIYRYTITAITKRLFICALRRFSRFPMCSLEVRSVHWVDAVERQPYWLPKTSSNRVQNIILLGAGLRTSPALVPSRIEYTYPPDGPGLVSCTFRCNLGQIRLNLIIM